MAQTLLVIDDDPSVREVMRLLLEHRGYEVIVADSGAAGLARATERNVDGALIDVHMTGMNGIEVCRILREQAAAAGRKLPVWIMTGARSAPIIKAAAEAGALVVLSKPFSHGELYQRIEAELGPAPANRRFGID
jgi:two-component system chemotaxis response regulator CheY